MARTLKNKEINLLAALERGGARRRLGKGAIIAIVLAAALAGCTVLFFVYQIGAIGSLKNRQEAAQDYVSEHQGEYDDALAMQQQAQQAQAKADAVTAAVEGIASYPDMTSTDYKNLYSIAGSKVTITNISYSRETGMLTFTGKTGSATRVPIFISALRQSGMFSGVSYDGWAGGSYTEPGTPQQVQGPDGTTSVVDTQVSKSAYTFSVTCIKSKASGEEQDE
jgi:hypothetical protein